MKVALLGGSGFIGNRLADWLVARHDVTVVDKQPPGRRDVTYIAADIRDGERLADALAEMEVVYNLAAEHRDDVEPESLYYDVNVDGARRCCEAAAAAGLCRQIFVSSVAVYGVSDGMADETTPPHPTNSYGDSKLQAEAVYRAWQADRPGERSLTIVRPTAVFGEGNRGNLYNLFQQVRSGYFALIGSGRNIKSIAYVDNVAAFLAYMLRQESGQAVYNYADKPDFDMAGLVDAVRRELGFRRGPLRIPKPLGYAAGLAFEGVSRLSGRGTPISRARVAKFCATTRFSADRAGAAGFEAPVSLADGLRRTLAYEFRCEASAPERGPIGSSLTAEAPEAPDSG